MRGIISCTIVLLFLHSGHGQKLLDHKVWSGFDEMEDELIIKTDDQQNIYVLGKNEKPFDLDFGPATANLTGAGWFLAKYDQNFNLLFYRTFAVTNTVTALKLEQDRILLAYTYKNNNSSFAQVVSIDQTNGTQKNVFAFTAANSARINSIEVDSRGVYYFGGSIGGNATIFTQVANQIGTGENGVLIRYAANSFNRNWFRRFTNLGFSGNNKDISTALVFLKSDNEIVAAGNSEIATYVFEQDQIQVLGGGGFITSCDSLGKFKAIHHDIIAGGNTFKTFYHGKIGDNDYLYDNDGIEMLNADLEGEPISLPYKEVNGSALYSQFTFNNDGIYFTATGKDALVDGDIIKVRNEDTQNHFMGALDAQGKMLWYHHMMPYKAMTSARMIPMGENKVLFTAIINETLDLDPDVFNKVEIEPANGKRFFALYNVICDDLRLKINPITNLACDVDTALVEISLSSPRGVQSMKLDNVNQDLAKRKFEFNTPGLHEWLISDENCSIQKSLYIEGPVVEKTKPSLQLDVNSLRAGVSSVMDLSVQSLNCENTNGTVAVTFPEIMENIEIALPHQWLSDTVVEIETGDITYAETFHTVVQYKINSNTAAGTSFCVKASFVSANETVNTFFCGEVKNSEDFNDLMSFPGGRCVQNYVLAEEALEYLIHFQNTGNDFAFTVTILDRLDESLDISSFRLLEASHPVEVTLYERVLNFHFKDINLQNQSTDEALSKGFVRFTVRQKADNDPGIQYTNKAQIIFDYNDAITTNEVFHTLTDVLPSCIVVNTKDSPLSNIKAYPNPVNQLLYLEGSRTDVKTTLFSTTGQVMWDRRISLPTTLNMEAIANGSYLLKISDGENVSWMPLIIAH